LLLLCGHYVDDFTGIEWDTTAEDGFLSFAKMGSIIGTTMKESKAQPPAKEHKLLGARVGFSANPAATAHIRPDPDRVKKISAEIKEATSSDYLNSDQASRLCGKLNFLNCTMFGRASGSALKPLYSRANSGNKHTSISTPIKAAFKFLLQVLQNPKPRTSPMLQDQHRRVSILYADAFFDAGDMAKRGELTPWDGEAVASLRNGWGCVIIPDQARPEEGYMMRGEIPHDIVRAFSETRAYIYFLEALAQIIPVLVAGEYLNQYYISFVDNEAAKHALGKRLRIRDSREPADTDVLVRVREPTAAPLVRESVVRS
jgi:hypothetical protein